jgi:hypothetical protein
MLVDGQVDAAQDLCLPERLMDVLENEGGCRVHRPHNPLWHVIFAAATDMAGAAQRGI